MGEAVGVDLGLVLPPAPEPDPVGSGGETVVDVGDQDILVEPVERGLPAVVGQGLVPGSNPSRRRRAPPARGIVSNAGAGGVSPG